MISGREKVHVYYRRYQVRKVQVGVRSTWYCAQMSNVNMYNQKKVPRYLVAQCLWCTWHSGVRVCVYHRYDSWYMWYVVCGTGVWYTTRPECTADVHTP